jgi:hypothetical protein
VVIVTGFQVPVIPLFEVAGKAGGVEFRQSGPICVKVGMILDVTTILIVAAAAHWPADGVNV